MPQKTARLNVRIPEYLHSLMEEIAEETDRPVSNVARDCFEMYALVEPEIWGRLDKLSETFNLPRTVVVRAIITKYFARMDASDKVFGKHPTMAAEFTRSHDGEWFAEPIYRLLYDHETARLRDNLERIKEWQTLREKVHTLEREHEVLKEDYEAVCGELEATKDVLRRTQEQNG